MKKVIFQSPKKHRVIAIKKLLAEHDIPITNIKLHISVAWSHGGINAGQAGIRVTETREKRNELNVPIEEFTDKLNDAQSFELYTDAHYEELALELIEACDEETFFGDCIFKSESYDEAFEVYSLLNKNDIPCDDVFPGVDGYVLFIEPVHIDKALEIIQQNYKEKFYKYKKQKPKNQSEQTYQETDYRKGIFKFLPLF